MKKKILLALISINLFICIILSFYLYFQPDKNKIVPVAGILNTTTINYESLDDYLLSLGDSTTQYLFFCAPANTECIYIQNTIIKPLEAKQGQNLFDHINYVDTTILENGEYIQEVGDWKFINYPVFAAVTITNGEIVVDNFIEHTPDNPISEEELKLWLSENGIWSGLLNVSKFHISNP
ncbi:MAG: hypothetical protein ACK5KQ_05370 [Anaerorhabdus sp.]